MTTVYDVADLAGVSTATVSRVIHGSPLVHPDTQQRVRAAIDQLGFVPDGSAQGLSRRRKDIIGLAALERGTDEIDIEQTGQLFVDEVVHAVESVLRGTECSLLLTFGQAGEQFQRRIWSLSGKVDGLLVAEEIMPASRLRALGMRIPVVVIAGRPGERELDMVAVDNTAGIRALAAHLIDRHGYRRLSFLAGPADSPDAQERLAAFRQAVGDTQPTATSAEDGLAMRAFREGSPYGGEDFFSASGPDFIARCSREAATPGMCLSERRVEGADLTFRFPRSWLAHWHEVADAMDRLTQQLHGQK